MLGDVAVAVHPSDERYKHLHGKELGIIDYNMIYHIILLYYHVVKLLLLLLYTIYTGLCTIIAKYWPKQPATLSSHALALLRSIAQPSDFSVLNHSILHTLAV